MRISFVMTSCEVSVNTEHFEDDEVKKLLSESRHCKRVLLTSLTVEWWAEMSDLPISDYYELEIEYPLKISD